MKINRPKIPDVFTDYLKIFQKPYKRNFRETFFDFEMLKGGVSERKIFRLISENNSAIAVINNKVKENTAFASFAKAFLSKGLRVPDIYYISRDNKHLLIQDSGKITLFDYSRKNRDTELLYLYYRNAIKDLIDFQLIGSECIDFSKCYETIILSERQLLKDFYKFEKYFINSISSLKLENGNEIKKVMMESVTGTEKNYFIYRDFQPRNILLNKRKLYYIDFQSGRKGPVIYDLVSFLYSGSIIMDDSDRNIFADYYKNALIHRGFLFKYDFKEKFNQLALSRIVQILGSYAYNKIVRNNDYVIKKIPYAIKNLNIISRELDNDYLINLSKKLTFIFPPIKS